MAGLQSRQATHTILQNFWVPKEEPPGDMTLAARRRKHKIPVSGFLMNCLAVMNIYQATRTNFGSILMLWMFWDDFDREKNATITM